MKEIPLTKGYKALVDDEDYEHLSKYKWTVSVNKTKTKAYAYRNPRINKKQTSQLMHRVIAKAEIGIDIDHVDGNGLNNQKVNLRTCTESQNLQNREKHKKLSSIYKGVHFEKDRSKFRARIKVCGKSITLGRFDKEEDAAKKYNEAAQKYFLDFAKLNVIF